MKKSIFMLFLQIALLTVCGLCFAEVFNADVYKASSITANELDSMSLAGSSKITAAGSYSIWGGKGAIVTAPNKMAVKLNNDRVDSIVSATNIDGTTASIVPKVGDTKRLTNYIKVATPQSGKEIITVNYSINPAKKMLDNPHLSYWILITDEVGKIIAVKDLGDISKALNVVQKVDFETEPVNVGENIIIGFSRGSGSGSLLVHSVSQTPVM